MSANKTLTTHNITAYDFDPDSTSATAVAWVDMRDYSGLTVMYYKTVGTGDLTSIVVSASASSSGTSPTVIYTHTITDQPDAVGDYIFFEIDADDISEGLDGGRYVSALPALTTSTDEAIVTYIRTGARFASDGETSNSVA